jgi:hypothetical protein
MTTEMNFRIKTDWNISDLQLDEDAVLRGQGAEPSAIRTRKPRLVELATQALEQYSYLLEPKVIFRQLYVNKVAHEKIELEDGCFIRGGWITQQLAPAKRVIALLCTVGSGLDDASGSLWDTNPLLALALDGVGSAGVEALAQAACQQVEVQANLFGLQTTIPFSPGMIEWPVETGQPIIFELLSEQNNKVELTSSYMMKPRKSLSMLLGVGPDFGTKGSTCDFCAMQEHCKYRQMGGHSNTTQPAG